MERDSSVREGEDVFEGLVAGGQDFEAGLDGVVDCFAAGFEDALGQKAVAEADPALAADAVLLKPLQFAKVAGFFMKADMLAGGITGAVASGVIPNVLGKTWVTSNNVPFNDPLLVDSEQLGGIATENLGSPGYTAVPGTVGLETKVMRIDDRDAYRPRVRRVGVAAVIEPRAGIRITGTGL